MTVSDRCLALAQHLAKAVAEVVSESEVVPEADLPVELRAYEKRRAA